MKSQHPSAQWNQSGGNLSSVEEITKKSTTKNALYMYI
jgi:hypothetical protein